MNYEEDMKRLQTYKDMIWETYNKKHITAAKAYAKLMIAQIELERRMAEDDE